jgi:hypothetical protein
MEPVNRVDLPVRGDCICSFSWEQGSDVNFYQCYDLTPDAERNLLYQLKKREIMRGQDA